MKRLLGIFVVLLVVYFGASFYLQSNPVGSANNSAPLLPLKIAPDLAYPDPKLTPGKADTLDKGALIRTYGTQTYSQAHRNVTGKVKLEVYKEYGVSYPAATGAYEVDHFYPLCAGGSNDIKNLWLEPSSIKASVRYLQTTNEVPMANPDMAYKTVTEDLGFHTKDRLETYICSQIKKGQLDPQEAFNKITTDWVSFYEEVKDKLPQTTLGAVE